MRKRRLFLIGILFALILLSAAANAGMLKVTEEHPFLVNGDWVPAKNLNEGDLLKTADGKSARIKSIKLVPDFVEVFNLEAGYFHNFILSDGLVVHNSNKPILPETKVVVRMQSPTSEMIISSLKKGEIVRSDVSSVRTRDFTETFYSVERGRFSASIYFIRSGDPNKGTGLINLRTLVREAQDIAKSMGFKDIDVYGIELQNIKLKCFLVNRAGFRNVKRYSELPRAFTDPEIIRQTLISQPSLEACLKRTLNVNVPIELRLQKS
ncbi:MAG: HINT domain-containing protein [Nanoarchaeota archaeon]|nr:HINT domain-containing protein [Nanoarchaeota archaeon]MBU4086638.1 HINT domain-containing protein [Nanoarchaeota archaeon]